MTYDFAFFDRPIDRCHTACDKWDGLQEKENRELLPMWVADMDFRCAQEIVDAIRRRAEHPVYGYTFERHGAVDAMLQFLERRYGVRLATGRAGNRTLRGHGPEGRGARAH